MDKDRVVAIMAGACDVDYSDWAAARRFAASAIKELQEYKDAEEKGLLVRIPCVVGSAIFAANSSETISEYIVSKIEINQDNSLNFIANNETEVCVFTSCEIGRKVFLSRRKAENFTKKEN